MAGNTASRVLRATPAATRETLSSPSFCQTRSRTSRQPALGISLGLRALRPRPGSLRSASSSDLGCGSGARTRHTEQPLYPRPSAGAMVAEDERLLRGKRGPALGAIHGRGHEMMMRREIAYRIGAGRIAGQQIGLAAAAAEVPPALRAAAAGLLHPILAAVAVERGGVVPDRADARLAHAREGEARQHPRRLAGQRDPIRRDAEEHPSESVHARLRPGLEVV